MKIYLNLEAPYEWVKVNGQNVEAFGEVASPDEYPHGEEDHVIGVVPGEWVTTHQVSLPAKTRKQFGADILMIPPKPKNIKLLYLKTN